MAKIEEQKFSLVLNSDVRFGAQDYTKGAVIGHFVPARGFSIKDLDKSLLRGEIRADQAEVKDFLATQREETDEAKAKLAAKVPAQT